MQRQRLTIPPQQPNRLRPVTAPHPQPAYPTESSGLGVGTGPDLDVSIDDVESEEVENLAPLEEYEEFAADEYPLEETEEEPIEGFAGDDGGHGGGGFNVPDGYVLVEESMYQHLLGLLSSPVPQPMVVATQPSDGGPVARLEVLHDCTLGDINTKLVKGTTIDWAPNNFIRYGGKTFNDMKGFHTYWDLQNPCHPNYRPSFKPMFRLLNPEVLERFFPGITARLRGDVSATTVAPVAPVGSVRDLKNVTQPPTWMNKGIVRAGAVPQSVVVAPAQAAAPTIPPRGTPERKAYIAASNPFGTPKPIPNLPGMTAVGSEKTVVQFAAQRAQQPTTGRRVVTAVPLTSDGKAANELLGAPGLPPMTR